jgi:hypothetical protein
LYLYCFIFVKEYLPVFVQPASCASVLNLSWAVRVQITPSLSGILEAHLIIQVRNADLDRISIQKHLLPPVYFAHPFKLCWTAG